MQFLMILSDVETAQLRPGDQGFPERMAAYAAFTDKVTASGQLVAAGKLRPTSEAATVRVRGGDVLVTDGPFAETKELLAGFWIWQVASMDEAVEWAKKAPFKEGELELRPIFEAEDFGAEFTPELREQEQRIREQVQSRS